MQARAVLLHSLLDLLLPARCAGCRAPGHACCPACAAALGGSPTLAIPRPCPAGLPSTWACASYDGPVRALLIAHKERGRHELTAPLSSSLVRAAAAAAAAEAAVGAGRRVLVVPVPSRPSATRARGYDHTRRLAEALAGGLRGLGWEAAPVPLLEVGRRVADQGELDARGRSTNLRHAYRARAPIPGTSRIVVVDDVITTGSTLVEAARALRAAGAVHVSAAVVAATQRMGFGPDAPRRPARD